jgi:Ser/Thr protein kinase RdoA (MazF antagonist)
VTPGVLARIPALAALDPGDILARPMNGHTNVMFALDTPVGGFALRLPRPGAADRIDRSDEQQVLQAVANLGITPPPLFFDAQDGTMLTRMEPGRHVRDRHSLRSDADAATALGAWLRKLHDAPLRLPWTFCAAEVMAVHQEPIGDPAMRRRLMDLAHRLDGSVERRVPCHDDVHPGNILWQGSRPWLIDWEYAGMNDPAFDLATARIELDLDGPAFDALLQGWGRDDASWRARIEDQVTLAHGIAGGWYLIQGRALADPVKVALGEQRLQACRQRLRGLSS